MIYEDRGSETKRKERKHLQREIQMCFTAASNVEFELLFFFPTFAFRRRYAALFLSSFQGGSRVQPPFIASPLPPPCDDIRASPRIFPKPLPLDNEQSFRCALLAGLFCLFVLGIGGCVFHPPIPPHYHSYLPCTYPSNLFNVRLSDLLFCFHEDSVRRRLLVSFLRVYVGESGGTPCLTSGPPPLPPSAISPTDHCSIYLADDFFLQ